VQVPLLLVVVLVGHWCPCPSLLSLLLAWPACCPISHDLMLPKVCPQLAIHKTGMAMGPRCDHFQNFANV
jgi:hypothetical protein